MSAEFASLVRWSKPTRSVVGSSARDTIVDADQENGSTNAVPVRLLHKAYALDGRYYDRASKDFGRLRCRCT
ncbi:hypothetical protein, partial [Methylobacterium sp. WL116]|uniref:hypothetical protein n=1 Tax=Methylobacterium sp. WL116 TaxID=2603889 RepID=UPI001AEDA244